MKEKLNVAQLYESIIHHKHEGYIAVNVKVRSNLYFDTAQLERIFDEIDFGKIADDELFKLSDFRHPHQYVNVESCVESYCMGNLPLLAFRTFLETDYKQLDIPYFKKTAKVRDVDVPVIDYAEKDKKEAAIRLYLDELRQRSEIQPFLTEYAKELEYGGRSNGWVHIVPIEHIKEQMIDPKEPLREAYLRLEAIYYIITEIKARIPTRKSVELFLKHFIKNHVEWQYQDYLNRKLVEKEFQRRKQAVLKYYVNRPGRKILIPIVTELLNSLSRAELMKKYDLYCTPKK